MGPLGGQLGVYNALTSSAVETAPNKGRSGMVKTLKQAKRFVEKVKICTLFSDKIEGVRSLWDAVDLPEKGGGRSKWGARVEAVWTWKNELPEKFPDCIFYGKLPGGHAALMTLAYLRDTHYPAASKPPEACSELAQQVYEIIRRSSGTTAEIRKQAIAQHACTKSRFDTALKQLQTTLNIARVPAPAHSNDSWVPFSELYLDIAQAE